jgi:esterase/lipase superfamily enzyme
MEMLRFGWGGEAILVFPTSMGRYFEYEDNGMVGSLWRVIHEGHLQLFCVDSVDEESWYNKRVPPRWRISRHMQYENYIMNEVVPMMRHRSSRHRFGVTGASFGGYHALNLALRHAHTIHTCITMGGAFENRAFLHGYYDNDFYFYNPPDYLPNMSDHGTLEEIRRMRLILATGEHDICLADNQRMSGILNSKGIPHGLDVWGNGTAHDWPWWRQMAQNYFG